MFSHSNSAVEEAPKNADEAVISSRPSSPHSFSSHWLRSPYGSSVKIIKGRVVGCAERSVVHVSLTRIIPIYILLVTSNPIHSAELSSSSLALRISLWRQSQKVSLGRSWLSC
jgi:hypothetical protein